MRALWGYTAPEALTAVASSSTPLVAMSCQRCTATRSAMMRISAGRKCGTHAACSPVSGSTWISRRAARSSGTRIICQARGVLVLDMPRAVVDDEPIQMCAVRERAAGALQLDLQRADPAVELGRDQLQTSWRVSQEIQRRQG